MCHIMQYSIQCYTITNVQYTVRELKGKQNTAFQLQSTLT